ncbi:MAG: FKBP-type peptidyl-prolyl cis-trans isomerase [Desulfonatronovibrio sp. MSAO_Bac4]|nr:MAG: FKBP-type peptidyl-prolyl cis-trans isomerase [Desulfonatronovibrio sp. MSAO_Bac4]
MTYFKTLLLSLFCLTIAGCSQSGPEHQDKQDQPVNLDTSVKKSSYALGFDIGSNLTQGEMNLDTDILLRGLKDAMEKNDPLMTQDEQFEALMALQQEFMQAQMEKAQAQSETNIEQGIQFMEEFRELDGVQETESGMLYRIINDGEGELPGPADTVTVHYRGTLVDGTVFDSSIERGEPATFPLNQVIAGWTEILQMMPVGSKWEVVIPPDQAYGEQQAGEFIGPNSTLVFEIELLETMSTE